MDIHSLWSTAEYWDDRPQLHWNTFLHPMDIQSLWPTAEYWDDRPRLHKNTYIYSMGIHLLWPIAGYWDVHSQLHRNPFLHPMDIHLLWPTARRILRWLPLAALEHVLSSHWHPFALAHCRILRWPPSAALEHVISYHGHPFALNHCRIFKCPCLAKLVHAKYVYRYPWSFSHIKAASCPCFAAQADIASPSMHENTRCAHSKIQACKYPCWCAHSKMSNRPYEAALFKMTRRCLTSFPASSRYSSTQDTDDTTFSIVVVLSALTLVLRYISRKMREVPPMNLKNPMPRNVKTSLSTSGGRSYIVL